MGSPGRSHGRGPPLPAIGIAAVVVATPLTGCFLLPPHGCASDTPQAGFYAPGAYEALASEPPPAYDVEEVPLEPLFPLSNDTLDRRYERYGVDHVKWDPGDQASPRLAWGFHSADTSGPVVMVSVSQDKPFSRGTVETFLRNVTTADNQTIQSWLDTLESRVDVPDPPGSAYTWAAIDGPYRLTEIYAEVTADHTPAYDSHEELDQHKVWVNAGAWRFTLQLGQRELTWANRTLELTMRVDTGNWTHVTLSHPGDGSDDDIDDATFHQVLDRTFDDLGVELPDGVEVASPTVCT